MTISAKKIAASALLSGALLIGVAAHGGVVAVAGEGPWYKPSPTTVAGEGPWYKYSSTTVERAGEGPWYKY